MKIIKPLSFSNFEFTRASEATYYNSSGILSTAAVDVLRQGYDPETLGAIGPIFESEATNLLPYSNDFTEWTPNNVSSEIGAETPPVAPDASSPVQFMDDVGSDSWGIRYNVGALTGEYTLSLFVKMRTDDGAGYSSFTLSLFTGFAIFRTNYATASVTASGGVIGTSIQKVGNGWLRVSITVDLLYTGSDFFARINQGLGYQYMWGAQLEEGTSPTSFIYTDGTTETRAPDLALNTIPSVISTNVAEDEAPEWDNSTTYDPEDLVQVLGIYHQLYSAVSTNTDKFPPNNTPAIWIYKGNTNPWRMFDMSTGAEFQTEATDVDNSISVELLVPRGVDSVVLLNVSGTTVTIVVRDVYGEIVGEFTQNLLSTPPDTGWWDFFFGERGSTGTVIYNDFSLATEGTITVTVEGGDLPALVGKLIVGSSYTIGCARFGTSAGIIDFSRKERDAFGNNVIVERRYIDKCEYDILIDTQNAFDIKNFLATIRATPAVYIGSDDHLITVVFGFYRDFSIILQGPDKSSCALQVEGI